jgi:RHS repeat-associated protein
VAQTAPTQTITDPSVVQAYDEAGRLTSITDWLGSTTSFDYDEDGNLIAQTYPNGTAAALTYNRAGELTNRTDSDSSGTLLALPYSRNDRGPLTEQNQSGTTTGPTSTLSYDPRHQLSGVAAGSSPIEAYVHDLGDRLTRMDDAMTARTLEYDAANQLTQILDPTTSEVLSSFTYDDLGNRIEEQPAGDGITTPEPTTYGYDQASHLTSVNRTGTTLGPPAINRTYAYDGDGLRSDLLWNPTSGLPLVLADDDALYVTGPNGLPLEQLGLDGARRFYHQDQLGSTRVLTDATGTVTSRRDYDAYGNPASAPTEDAPFGYAGQYTDDATGLIYMRARWYDPGTGQFTTKDPIGQASGETNLYRYAAGDPANNIDPTGLFDLTPGFVDDAVDFVHDASTFIAPVAGVCAIGAAATVILAPAAVPCGTAALAAAGAQAATGAVRTIEGRQSGEDMALDAVGLAAGAASKYVDDAAKFFSGRAAALRGRPPATWWDLRPIYWGAKAGVAQGFADLSRSAWYAIEGSNLLLGAYQLFAC